MSYLTLQEFESSLWVTQVKGLSDFILSIHQIIVLIFVSLVFVSNSKGPLISSLIFLMLSHNCFGVWVGIYFLYNL